MPGEAGDRPLVVDDVEDHRRAVDAAKVSAEWKSPSAVEPSPIQPIGDPGVALVAARHRPADRLRELRAEIAGDREEAVRLGRIHDRQLAALQLVAVVRIDLVHHLDQRIAARDQQALLAIGREAHVVAVERDRRRRPRSPPRRCTSCRSWSCPAAARGTCGRRRRGPVTMSRSILRSVSGVELRVPRADRLVVVVEHADERGRQRVSLGGGAATSGRGALPAAGIFSDEKSGVSPGRNGGSGTCSASFGALRRSDGSLSLMSLGERLIASRACGNYWRQVYFTRPFPRPHFALTGQAREG